MIKHLRYIPIDKTTIKTKLRIHSDLFDNPSNYIDEHHLQIRTFKLTQGKCKRGPTRNLTLDVLAYKGIKAKLRKISDDPLSEVTIEFNPGMCLFSHNGSALLLREYFDALDVLAENLRPILLDPYDWIDLIPGLRSNGVAYWHYIELSLQIADPDGRVLSGYRNVQGYRCDTPIRHWDNSIEIGRKGSNMQFSIYRKAFEMLAHNRLSPEQLENEEDILRLEVRLMGKKLVKYFSNERNMEVIDGLMRLVRFYPQDCVEAHRASFSNLRGVYHSNVLPLETSTPKGQNAPLGQLLARVALDPRTSLTFQNLRNQLQFYTGAPSDTIGDMSSAGIEEMSRLSSLMKEDIFSDAAYRNPSSIISEMREEKVFHDIVDTSLRPLICKEYQPPNQLFFPITQFRPYQNFEPSSKSRR
jgi:hypothetical protein